VEQVLGGVAVEDRCRCADRSATDAADATAAPPSRRRWWAR